MTEGRRLETAWRSLVLMAVVAVVLLVGCGGEEDAGADGTEIEAGDSDVVANAGSGGGSGSADLGEFSVMNVPDGIVYVAYAAADQVILDYPAGEFDRIVSFFDDFTSQEGGYQRQQSGSGGFVYTNTLADDSADLISITVGRDVVSSDLDNEGVVTFVTIARTSR
jgi:hypothetical protein